MNPKGAHLEAKFGFFGGALFVFAKTTHEAKSKQRFKRTLASPLYLHATRSHTPLGHIKKRRAAAIAKRLGSAARHLVAHQRRVKESLAWSRLGRKRSFTSFIRGGPRGRKRKVPKPLCFPRFLARMGPKPIGCHRGPRARFWGPFHEISLWISLRCPKTPPGLLIFAFRALSELSRS